VDSFGNLLSMAALPVPLGETDHGVEMSRAGILSCLMVPALGGPALVVLAVGLLLAGGVLGRFSVGLRLRWS
jgi:hypothetical protein